MLTLVETGEPGGLLLELPDKVPATSWVPAGLKEQGERAAGYPTGDEPDAGVACRCGQVTVSKLRVRLGTRKVLCVDCASLPLPVEQGDTVAFRLSRSDLAPYARHVSPAHLDSVQLRGVVEGVLQFHELLVRVDDWPVAHTVSFYDLDERPGTRADMDDFWPDTDPAVLDQAFDQIRAAGAFTVVSSAREPEDDY